MTKDVCLCCWKKKLNLNRILNLLLALGKQFKNYYSLHNVKVSADVKVLPNKSLLPNVCRSQNCDTRFSEKERAFIILGSTQKGTGDTIQICLLDPRFGVGWGAGLWKRWWGMFWLESLRAWPFLVRGFGPRSSWTRTLHFWRDSSVQVLVVSQLWGSMWDFGSGSSWKTGAALVPRCPCKII